jgi:RsiW-degrading membrane proteinase PrsW (M82 family)
VAEFYPFSIHLIYAVIITLSFEVASRVFIPFNSVWSSYDNIERSASLFLTYFVIISGWIGYSKSISARPHMDNRLGTIRFGVDLFILFLVFYIISLTDPSKFPKFGVIFPTFLWTITLMFMAYLVWDVLKYFEYRNTEEKTKTNINRGRKTLYYFIPISIMLVVHNVIRPPYNTLEWNGIVIWDFIFIVFVFIIVFFYRRSKWIVPPTTSHAKPRKRGSGVGGRKSSDG